jgi:hypothetical protein
MVEGGRQVNQVDQTGLADMVEVIRGDGERIENERCGQVVSRVDGVRTRL